jgi:hypothetical protein
MINNSNATTQSRPQQTTTNIKQQTASHTFLLAIFVLIELDFLDFARFPEQNL